MDKPRICEVLGVDINEEWYIDNSDWCRINEQGYREVRDNGNWRLASDEHDLAIIINNPDRIIHKTYWTEQDIEDAKAVKRLFPTADGLSRADNLNSNIYVTSFGCATARISGNQFPSLQKGMTVRIADILGDEC